MTPYKFLILILCLLISIPASAYIGPGAGISFLGSLFSTLFVILLTIGSILFWPLRYMWKRLKRLRKESKKTERLDMSAHDVSSMQSKDDKPES